MKTADLPSLLNRPERFNWSREEIAQIYTTPLPSLMFQAQAVHHEHHDADEMQMSSLLSIKTGGCKENCSYCPQSAHHDATVDATGLLQVDEIVQAAQNAKSSGATRFCMGAAWSRPPKKGPQFERVLETASAVRELGMEVCMTLGMLDDEQAQSLEQAGCQYYNHNLDTSPEYYEKIITTRTYQDRLDTLASVRKSGMNLCTGGIVGMGESREDRYGLLQQLASLQPHPESVPINLLVKVEGTPLAEEGDLEIFELVRTLATARVLMPKSQLRLSAGRRQMTDEAQAMCFLAGANSIFAGEKLLTTPNPGEDRDKNLLDRLGLQMQEQSDVAPIH